MTARSAPLGYLGFERPAALGMHRAADQRRQPIGEHSMYRPTLAAALALALAAVPLSFAAGQPMQMPPPITDPAQAASGHYVVDPHHAALLVTVQHMGLAHSTFR